MILINKLKIHPYYIFAKEKWLNDGFQKYFQNMSWMFAGRVLTILITFLVNIYIARYLQPLDYGILNYVLSFVGLFAILPSLGVDSILLRELSYNKEKRNSLLGTAFTIKGIGAILAFLLVIVIVFVGKIGSYERLLILIYSTTFFFSAFNVIEIFFQSSVLSKKTVFVQITSTIIVTAFKIYLLINNYGTGWFILAYVLDSLLLAIGSIYVYKKYKEQILKWCFHLPTAKILLNNSWPIILAGFAGMIYLKIDQVMIRNILDNYQLGIYSAAVKLSEFWYFIPGVIAGSVFPAIINAKKTSEGQYLSRLKKLNWLLILIALVIAIPVSLFSKQIINLIFGAKYILSAPSLSVYIWAGVAVFWGAGIAQYLIAENKTVKFFITTSTGALVNIILNFYMIPLLGIVGAAWASLISYFVVPLMLLSWKDTRGQIINLFKFK
ncbi:MAG: flippase [bacterium]|nr:flippase [bacterium]